MNEVKVRFPCEHGHWFKHVAEFAPKWVWCDGGTTRHLKLVDQRKVAVLSDDDRPFNLYVEYVETDE